MLTLETPSLSVQENSCVIMQAKKHTVRDVKSILAQLVLTFFREHLANQSKFAEGQSISSLIRHYSWKNPMFYDSLNRASLCGKKNSKGIYFVITSQISALGVFPSKSVQALITECHLDHSIIIVIQKHDDKTFTSSGISDQM